MTRLEVVKETLKKDREQWGPACMTSMSGVTLDKVLAALEAGDELARVTDRFIEGAGISTTLDDLIKAVDKYHRAKVEL